MSEIDYQIEDYMEYCDSKNLSRKTIESYEKTLKLFALFVSEKFDEKDVSTICRSGASNKVRGTDIGHRGIGFKSTTSIENLYLGQKVYLKSDFNNKYDSNAIEVFTNDNVSIGYLYHSDAMMWCKVIREGIKIEGEICEYKPLRERNSNAKSAIVKIKIYRVNT